MVAAQIKWWSSCSINCRLAIKAPVPKYFRWHHYDDNAPDHRDNGRDCDMIVIIVMMMMNIMTIVMMMVFGFQRLSQLWLWCDDESINQICKSSQSIFSLSMRRFINTNRESRNSTTWPRWFEQTFYNSDKNILWFRQIHFIILLNTFCNLDRYIWSFGQYISQSGQNHLIIWGKYKVLVHLHV